MGREALNIGIAGLGTVGVGVLRILKEKAALIEARTGKQIRVAAVSARNRSKDRGADLSACRWEDDPLALASAEDVDVVVELIGGADGPALELVQTALGNGKSVVSANKAMLAHHGVELAKLAEDNGAALYYEAAVAAAIPVIKTLRESFAGNRIEGLAGILNGTCNYILTEMADGGRDYADVLAEAQELGYAEADPSFDVDGVDASHKLALLSALAFGVRPDLGAMPVKGISRISIGDILYADELGYCIRLLGLARRRGDGRIEQSVEPCLVPLGAEMASVHGVLNAVSVSGDMLGSSMLVGAGAGREATASAVVGDLADLARGGRVPVFGVPAAALAAGEWAEPDSREGRYYLHIRAVDKPGVLAAIAGILRDEGVSIESFIQRGRDPGQAVSVVLTTHETTAGAMRRALESIADLDVVLAGPLSLRIAPI